MFPKKYFKLSFFLLQMIYIGGFDCLTGDKAPHSHCPNHRLNSGFNDDTIDNYKIQYTR